MMNLRLIIPILIISLIFISGCTRQDESEATTSQNTPIQGMSVAEIKTVVYESIADHFPSVFDSFSVDDFEHQNLDKRCGDEWYFDLGTTSSAPYARIQVCDNGRIYTLDELYLAYQELANSYKENEEMQGTTPELTKLQLTNGNVIAFKIKNSNPCEDGVTLRFPCRDRYVVELITIYSCNDVTTEGKLKKVANEILSYC